MTLTAACAHRTRLTTGTSGLDSSRCWTACTRRCLPAWSPRARRAERPSCGTWPSGAPPGRPAEDGAATILERIASHGCLPGGDADARRITRASGAAGSSEASAPVTLPRDPGVDAVYDGPAAAALGLQPGGITVMIHTGSRGLGHQVCTDALRRCEGTMQRHRIVLPDRQLACAPAESEEARDYLAAMRGAANFAFANRHVLAHWAEQAFLEALGLSPADLGWRLVYDVAHNVAKEETHTVAGRRRRLIVHRKGATRAFARASRATRGVPEHRPAGAHPGRHGALLVRPPGDRRAMTETSQHLPRRRPGHEPHRGGEGRAGRESAAELRARGVSARATAGMPARRRCPRPTRMCRTWWASWRALA